MRTFALTRPLVLIFLCCAACQSLPAGPPTPQQQPVRDAEASTLLQNAITAMGGQNAPSDSQATGTIDLVAGSQNDSGTVTILTRGTAQTSEQIAAQYTQRTVIFSNGQANLVKVTGVVTLPLELVATSQCPDFPLPLLVGEVNNPDWSIQYVGLETLNGSSVQHIRLWNTYYSNPPFQGISGFTTQDLWLDATSGLPQELSYIRRAGSGDAPSIEVQVYYSSYVNQGGVLYPFQIQKSFNGTPWVTITIQAVAFNVGLTDANFPIQ